MIGVLLVGIAVVLTLSTLSGCTSNQTQDKTTGNVILGTWRGTTQISGGFQRNDTTAMTVSQVTFRNSDLELTVESPRGTFSMNYTYAFTGDTLVLRPESTGNPFGGQSPFNGSRPWNGSGRWNGTRPPGNGTWPPNGTAPPFNGTMPWNRTRPGNWSQGAEDRRSFMQLSMTYSWDEQTQTLYLNGSAFTKVR